MPMTQDRRLNLWLDVTTRTTWSGVLAGIPRVIKGLAGSLLEMEDLPVQVRFCWFRKSEVFSKLIESVLGI